MKFVCDKYSKPGDFAQKHCGFVEYVAKIDIDIGVQVMLRASVSAFGVNRSFQDRNLCR